MPGADTTAYLLANGFTEAEVAELVASGRGRPGLSPAVGWRHEHQQPPLGTVLVETTGAVGRVTLNAPERLNAVDPEMCRPWRKP